jgi:hypothetical protein
VKSLAAILSSQDNVICREAFREFLFVLPIEILHILHRRFSAVCVVAGVYADFERFLKRSNFYRNVHFGIRLRQVRGTGRSEIKRWADPADKRGLPD